MVNKTEAEYLGDGVYATFDGFNIWLTVERDHGHDRVALEPMVFEKLLSYRAKVYKEADSG